MFDADMSVEVNPTLGKGSDTVRMMTLQQIKQDQMMVFQQFGPQNPVVGIPEMLNTITDMLAIANIKNTGRYFKTPDPQTIQQMQTAPKEPDAMTIAARANYERVKSQTAKAIGDPAVQRPEGGPGRGVPPRQARPGAGLRGREAPGAGGRSSPSTIRSTWPRWWSTWPRRSRRRAILAAACREAKSEVSMTATEEVVMGTTWLPMVPCRRSARQARSKT